MPPDWSILAKEASRKSIHLAGAVVPLAYYFFIPRELLLLILGVALAVAAALEYIRLSGNPIFPRILLRGHEEKGVIGGYFFALLSTFLAVLLFDKAIAVVAILFLDVGDAFTGLAGAVMSMLLGRSKADTRDYDAKVRPLFGELCYAASHPKSPALMAVMFMVCGLIGLAFYPSLSPLMIIIGALGAVIADAFPWRLFGFVIDDNLSIPLLSGALMCILN
ncbi:Dolichol kinase [Methanocella conradii HZ254]|uniref:Dolichol kinase n=1 Tax=Methanocella conradii (strain DSM 24694 / JCM 17849 / CGMCC 1.5162 / HZ254) TaxID=1041930 RepID=H8I707_METCZ|nr:dolichol kinase [Methanocella conradii]AFC99837.1 Dolichol kinase [Methanocella conradii HZ254]MDI6896446.1 dolichol kinase [Methanocella conradii]